MIFSEKLQLIRKNKGLTQEELAEKFAGEEAIWLDGKIQYAMNYLGRVLDQQFSGDFLKEALRKADEMKEEDERRRQAALAKNRIENLLFGVKGQIEDEKMAAKFSEEDKEKIKNIVEEEMRWLEDHQEEEKDVYDDKFKEVQEKLKPLTGAAGQAGPSGAGADADADADDDADDDDDVEHDDL